MLDTKNPVVSSRWRQEGEDRAARRWRHIRFVTIRFGGELGVQRRGCHDNHPGSQSEDVVDSSVRGPFDVSAEDQTQLDSRFQPELYRSRVRFWN